MRFFKSDPPTERVPPPPQQSLQWSTAGLSANSLRCIR